MATSQQDPPFPDAGFTPVMMGWIRALVEWLKSWRIVQGPGIQITDAPGGGKMISATVVAALQALTLSPFKVLIQTNATGGKDRGVVFRSMLFDQIGTAAAPAPITIVGLLTNDKPAKTDDGWANTADGDEIWLELAFAAWPTLDTVTIKSKVQDGDIFASGDVEHDGMTPPTQTKARVLLAKIENDGAGGLRVVQYCNSNLRLAFTPTTAYAAAGNDPRFLEAVYPFTYP